MGIDIRVSGEMVKDGAKVLSIVVAKWLLKANGYRIVL
jgi:hypothetical protein